MPFFQGFVLTVLRLAGFPRFQGLDLYVCVCVHLYEYLFITSSAFLDSYGSHFPRHAQSKASAALRQTNKLNPSHNRVYTVFPCVKSSRVKLSEGEFAGKWREKQQE